MVRGGRRTVQDLCQQVDAFGERLHVISVGGADLAGQLGVGDAQQLHGTLAWANVDCIAKQNSTNHHRL